jgi:hypothetical protein
LRRRSWAPFSSSRSRGALRGRIRLSRSGYQLTEEFNDARRTHYRDIADLLPAAERRLTRELNALPKEKKADGAA